MRIFVKYKKSKIIIAMDKVFQPDFTLEFKRVGPRWGVMRVYYNGEYIADYWDAFYESNPYTGEKKLAPYISFRENCPENIKKLFRTRKVFRKKQL